MATATAIPNRETGLSCTVCDRPICTECLRMTPVGPALSRPRDAGEADTPRARPAAGRDGASPTLHSEQPFVTWALIGLNVLVYLITVAQGGGYQLAGRRALRQVGCCSARRSRNGDWWRLITAAFLHGTSSTSA